MRVLHAARLQAGVFCTAFFHSPKWKRVFDATYRINGSAYIINNYDYYLCLPLAQTNNDVIDYTFDRRSTGRQSTTAAGAITNEPQQQRTRRRRTRSRPR
jgi:hypothetical protein